MSSLFAGETTHPVLQINEKFIPLKQNNRVSPYMTMIYALDLLENGQHTKMVKSFIVWYLEHMNKIDRFGVSGTVYDYNVSISGEEHSLETYDSADGYAGLFLYLVRRYYEVSKDRNFIQTVFPSLKDTMYLIYYLRDSDGLIKALAKKNYRMKYLMDNVEAYLGIESYLYLARMTEMEEKAQIEAYILFQNELKHAILKQLYDPDTMLFCWAKEGDKKYYSDETVFYPDMFAQIHILAFWGTHLDRHKAHLLWQKIKVLIDKRAVNMGIFLDEKVPHKSERDVPKIAMEQLIIFEWAKRFALENDL